MNGSLGASSESETPRPSLEAYVSISVPATTRSSPQPSGDHAPRQTLTTELWKVC